MSSVVETLPTGRPREKMSDEAFITSLVAGVAIILFLIASIMVPNFFQWQNVVNLVTNNWAVIALGIGVTFLLVSGNFDLSVGGIVALSGVLSVWFAQSPDGANVLSTGLGLPYPVAIACALAGALAIGGLNALFVVRFGIPSIIVTLGTMMVARGIAQVITHGSQRNTNLPEEFGFLGNLSMFGSSIKFPVVLMGVLLLLAIFVERKMVFWPPDLLDRGQSRGRNAFRYRSGPSHHKALSVQCRHCRDCWYLAGVRIQVRLL